jgi:hypothetical protein
VPADPPNGHLLVQVKACAINHGDRFCERLAVTFRGPTLPRFIPALSGCPVICSGTSLFRERILF